MKALFIFLLSSLFFIGCKDKPEPNVAALLIGDWKLTHYKMENQAWKDSTGTFYNFISDTLVNTVIFNTQCERKYSLYESNFGIKDVTFPVYYPSCAIRDWYTLSVVDINTTQMEISYLDEIGGTIVRKYERYQKE